MRRDSAVVLFGLVIVAAWIPLLRGVGMGMDAMGMDTTRMLTRVTSPR